MGVFVIKHQDFREILFTLVLVTSLGQISKCSLDRHMYMNIKDNTQITESSSTTDINTDSLFMCCTECLMTPGCCAASYGPGTLCRLEMSVNCSYSVSVNQGVTLAIADDTVDDTTPTQHNCTDLLNAHYGTGDGWTVIQQRCDGSVNFQRSWDEYKTGFGHLDGEFWIGNDQIHALTTSADNELRVDISDWEGNSWYAVYKTFRVENETLKYMLTVGNYNGTAGDSMAHHNGMFFSTVDVDNDISSSNCSTVFGGNGGWWFRNCDLSNFNGVHTQGSGDDGINWDTAKNSPYSMKYARMMIRPL